MAMRLGPKEQSSKPKNISSECEKDRPLPSSSHKRSKRCQSSQNVSERYPRDEDYASDSVCDSDSVTSEDYDSDFSDTQCVVPRWLFLDQEIEEAASQLSHENNRLEIVFGNFDQNSDLESISVSPLILIEPEFDEFSIKIGEIICPAIKQSDDEGENFAAPDLDSNTVKEIATGCEFGICDCNNDNVDPDLANQLHKHTVFSEIVPLTSIFVNDSATRLDVNVIFNASKSAKPQTKTRYDALSFLDREVEVKAKEKSHHIVEENDFFNYASEIVKPFKRMLQVPNQFLFSKTVLIASRDPDPVNVWHHDFAFGCKDWIDFDFTAPGHFLATLAVVDDCVPAKSFPGCSILEEMVKEMCLADPSTEVPYNVKNTLFPICREVDDLPFSVVNKEAAPPWKMRKEYELLLADLWNMVWSPEPSSELLRHGLQPYDPGDTRVLEASCSFLRVAIPFCCAFFAMPWTSFLFGLNFVFGPLLIGLH